MAEHTSPDGTMFKPDPMKSVVCAHCENGGIGPLTEAEVRMVRTALGIMRGYNSVHSEIRLQDEPIYGSAYDQARGKRWATRHIGTKFILEGRDAKTNPR